LLRTPCPGSSDLVDIVDRCVSESTTASIGVEPIDKIASCIIKTNVYDI
jgi:hypothetical protein